MIIDKSLVAARFEKSIPTYDDEAVVQRSVAHKLASLLEACLRLPAGRLLEIGCGTGFLSRELLQRLRPKQMTLNDLCPAMKERVKDILSPSVRFESGDAETHPFGSGWDVIASSSAVQWLPSPSRFAERCHELLVDGGCLAFSAYGPENLREITGLTGVGLSYPGVKEWGQMLGAGWRMAQAFDETVRLTFGTPVDVLRHLQRTGVTGVRPFRWGGKTGLRRFVDAYRRQFQDGDGVTLTYHPVYIVAFKSV